MYRIIGLIGLVLLAGCATMTSGVTQQVSFQSVPDDVIVTLTDGPPSRATQHETRILGKTPFTAQLDRADGQWVTFTKDGYTPLVTRLSARMNYSVWGNILVGGFFGTTTDNVSGAVHEYEPSHYFVSLVRVQTGLLDRNTGGSAHDQAMLFIMRRYDAVMSDLSRGHGEDLNALFTLLRVESASKASAQETLSLLATQYQDVAAFATHAANRYLRD